MLPFTIAALALCLAGAEDPPPCPVLGGTPVDHLIQPEERHLAHLWKLTSGGENAEGYWSFGGDRLSLQRTEGARSAGVCDVIHVTAGARPDGGVVLRRISSGRGVTTCSHFMPGDREVLFASTEAAMEACPPPADFSQGYVWTVHPEFDLYVVDLASGAQRRLTDSPGYDAEATISPLGDRMVFTSTRSGDLELWTSDLAGGDLRQITDAPGYDGGAFFSHDGKQLVFRSTMFDATKLEEELATYRRLLADWKVRPHTMELMLVDADGKNRRQLTHLGGASFAPYFLPDDRSVIFSSNHRDPQKRNFDLFVIGVDGEGLEPVTSYEGFDSFPMFSPDGRFVAFASNRGGETPGETNLFVAEWRP